jgi:hypothetical protein
MNIMAYGLATLVDYSRLRARQHFPSDVLVGSIMGNLIAQNVYSRHHDPGLGGGEWRSISQIFRGDGNSSPANQGSPYVPLDSWIYPALDRLIGMGMIDSGFSGVRPWTRSECTRLLTEASDRVDGGPAEGQKTFQLLKTEFREELEGRSNGAQFRGRIESVYTRFTEIAGDPLSLTDGYTFGQTLINDFGRPYERGFNSVTGFSAWSTAGRWVGYVRAEYQQSPSAPALPESARLAIAQVDPYPGPPPATPTPSIHQLRLLDAYVGLNLNNWQVTFGQQSLWWAPGNGGLCLHTILRDGNRVHLGISTGGHYLSEDGGETFTASNKGVGAGFAPDPYPEFGQCVHKIAGHKAAPGRLYMQNHGGWGAERPDIGVLRSDDHGHTWRSISKGLPSDFGFPIVVHPHDADTLYVMPLTPMTLPLSKLERAVTAGMIRSPIRWVGGKSRIRKTLLSMLPKHDCCVEVFGGAGWLLFAKSPRTIATLCVGVGFGGTSGRAGDQAFTAASWRLVTKFTRPRSSGFLSCVATFGAGCLKCCISQSVGRCDAAFVKYA